MPVAHRRACGAEGPGEVDPPFTASFAVFAVSGLNVFAEKRGREDG